jgi:hypothetical protein
MVVGLPIDRTLEILRRYNAVGRGAFMWRCERERPFASDNLKIEI